MPVISTTQVSVSNYSAPPTQCRNNSDISCSTSTQNDSLRPPEILRKAAGRVTKFASMQRFTTLNCNRVRYSSAQFAQLSGFKTQRCFAALSNVVMAQNENLNIALVNCMDWSAKSNNYFP
jgi:hypothetical protein